MEIDAQIMKVVKTAISSTGRFSNLDEINNETDLIASGYVDSITIMSILLDIEKCFNCRIPMHKIVHKNVSSIKGLSTMVMEETSQYEKTISV